MTVYSVNGKTGVVILEARDIPCDVPEGLDAEPNVQSVLDAIALAAGYAPPPPGLPGVPGLAVHFDAALPQWLYKSEALTGIVPAKVGTLSFWMRAPPFGTTRRILALGGSHLTVEVTNSGGLVIAGRGSAGESLLTISGSNNQLGLGDNGLTNDTTWFHILSSWDLSDITKRWLRINRLAKTPSWSVWNDGLIDYSNPTGNSIAASVSGTLAYTGDLCDLWFDPIFMTDTVTTLNKFNFQDGAADLGSEGQYPTGVRPALYQGQSLETWHVNKGYGEGFTLNGPPLTQVLGPGDNFPPPPPPVPHPARSDGTNDYLSLEHPTTGAAIALINEAASKLFTASIWVRPTVEGDASRTLLNLGGGRFIIALETASATLRVTGKNASGATILDMSQAASGLLDGLGHHLLMSLDMASTTNRWLRIDRVTKAPTWDTYTNAAIDFANPGGSIFGPAGNSYGGDADYFWFDVGSFLVNTTASLDLFNNAGHPMDVGPAGEIPTTAPPTIFLRGIVGEWATNKGTGGNFVEYGALTDGVDF